MLTDRTIKAAKSAAKTRKLSDGGGLQLHVTPTGSRLWCLAYRWDRKQLKLSLGAWPAVGLADARAKRDEARRLLAQNIDPRAQRKADAATKASACANTFDAVAAEVVDRKRREAKAVLTLGKISWLLSLASPAIGARPIADITAPEILAVLRTVETRGRFETARRLRSTISEVMRYAIATGRAETDPTYSLRGALTTPTVEHRAAIIEPKALGGLLRAIAGYDGMPETRAALGLLALTFTRPGELRAAEWQEFDLETAVWTIPAAKTKMRREHRVPLAPQAIGILRQLQEITGGKKYLFPSVRTKGACMSESTINAALRRLGFDKDEMTGHGFRSSASSLLNESGLWSADAIEKQLGHVEQSQVRRAYHRADHWSERVRLMNWWADYLDELRANSPK